MTNTPEDRASELYYRAVRSLTDVTVTCETEFSGKELYDQFNLAMRILAVWVVLGDGEMSIAESSAIGRIFWMGEDAVYNYDLEEHFLAPATVEGATKFVLHAIEALRDHLLKQSHPVGSLTNPICMAAEAVFQTALAADNCAEAEVERLTILMERFNASAKIDDIVEPPASTSDEPEQIGDQVADAPASAEEAEPTPPLAALDAKDVSMILAELDELIGLASVKHQVRTLTNLAKVFAIRREMALPVPTMSLHLVFLGNPGTGKTTVARIIAQVYGKLGLLSKGQLIEVDRSGLVANYVGQTASKTNAVIESALGGVLFIDEAYALDGSDATDFGNEAVAALLKGMEDHRDDLVVIAAGYPSEMHRFLDMNPGLRSRMCREIMFDDYTADEMVEIFGTMAKASSYTLSEDLKPALSLHFETAVAAKAKDFANARDVRNLFEQMIGAQANRLCRDPDIDVDELQTLTVEDLVGVSLDASHRASAQCRRSQS